MWLIDLHDIRIGKTNPDVFEDKSYAIGWNNAIQAIIETSPAIDPESLPIVKQLRRELERVTRERDAAISDLYYICACETCALHYTDRCPLKKGMVPCSHIASALENNTPYKWRGIQEVQEDE